MSTTMHHRLIHALASAAVLISMSARAHHSYVAFDQTKVITQDAVLRTFEFTNPHAYVWVYINNEQGKPELWGLEGPSPSVLLRNGWDKDTVKPGDKIAVQLNPLKDGRHGGSLVKMTLPDGRSLNAGGAPPADSKTP